ncbi:HD family phosphohydrolase [Vacuolonema iberomarrocanum]|uniref:HD family phosphohydrolase n=1 Tax=Vacuolonema iberomarrocanum TaxID=3454632 RepID=UPI0019F88541|nr:HDIG domain-containing protein [filamentous cyanobacterium LEGE 07170]
MKSFQRRVREITEPLTHLRQDNWSILRRRKDGASVASFHPKAPTSDRQQWLQQVQKSLNTCIDAVLCPPPCPKRKKGCGRRKRWSSAAIFAVAVVSLSSTIGYRLYNEPQLAVGTISPRTLRAPDLASVVDAETTESNRQAARIGAVPVLQVDGDVNQRIYQNLQRLLDEGDALRVQAGTFPFALPSLLSTQSQRYLRRANEEEWKAALDQAEGRTQVTESLETPTAQALAVVELQNYQRYASEDDYSTLIQSVERSRKSYGTALAALLQASPAGASGPFVPELLELTDTAWLETKADTRRILEQILTQGIPAGLPPELLARAVELHTREALSGDAATIAQQILVTVLEPNLVQDQEQTRLRAEQAAKEVDPVVIAVRRGEIIVEAGQPITQREFVLLDHFDMSERTIDWLGLVGFVALVSGGIGIFLLVERRFHPGLRRRDYILVTLLTLTTPLLAAVGIAATSLPAVGLLVGSFYGSALGATVVALLSVALPVGMDLGGRHLVASAIASLVGAFMAGKLRSREELALLGGGVGLTQGLTYLILSLIISPWTAPVWYSVLTASVVQALMGITWSVTALGLSPYLEQLFDIVTPSRLAELSNPNRPLLKRLAAEVPGTFQHTLFVATLSEAAARELGCNVELVRAGTLYHDIGKMHDPLGFIENQMGGPNKHDLIDDPWRSADIIKKHVTVGITMAKKYRLPKAIRSFIPEHQGSMQIAYFYHKAKERAAADQTIIVREEDFRYDGPIPQSRETGIVMLADSCEAALRSLKDATPQEALAMVNRILRARWQDQQLVDSGLERKEMPVIAEIFVKVWQDFNHQRIAYPKAPVAPPRPSPATR